MYVQGNLSLQALPPLHPDLCGGDDCQYRLPGTFPAEHL